MITSLSNALMAGEVESMMCKTSSTEEKPGMYPPEWWWAERQVREVLAENPGELVKTGTSAICNS